MKAFRIMLFLALSVIGGFFLLSQIVISLDIQYPEKDFLPRPQYEVKGLVFEIDDRNGIAGGYKMNFINQGERWVDVGNWTPGELNLGNPVTCISFIDTVDEMYKSTLYASTGYAWFLLENFQGRINQCFELRSLEQKP